MIKNQKLKVLYVLIVALFSIDFYQPYFLEGQYYKYIWFLFLFSAVIISIPYFFKEKGGFTLPLRLIIIGIVISMFMAFFSWGQSFSDSIIATVPYMLWIFFFYLLESHLSAQSIEKIMILLGLIGILIFISQYISYPAIYFGWVEDFKNERGTIRIGVSGFVYLLCFIALNKFTVKGRVRFLWGIIAAAGIIIPFLQATRQYIGAMLLIYIYHFIKAQKLYKKIIILIITAFAIVYVANTNIPIVRGIENVQENTMQLGTNYIRLLAGQFFLTNFSPNIESRILGNGFPYGKSSLGRYEEYLKSSHYFFLSDLGIIAVYVMFGIIAVLGYILIWVKSFTIQLPREYYYLKYYLWFLLISSLTSWAVYHYSFLVASVLTLYIYQDVSNIENNKSNILMTYKVQQHKS